MNLYRILSICSLFVVACSDENSDSIFNAVSENLTSSSWIVSNSSSSCNDVSSSSVAVAESSSSEPSNDPTKFFDIRIPNQKYLPCADTIVSSNYSEVWIDTVAQSDLICSFNYDGESGFIYVQNNPVSCDLPAGVIEYEVYKAELNVNDSMKEIPEVQYHGGGNHGVFGLKFAYKDKVFRYDYSTMGLGGRPCQNMDCLIVLESDRKTIIQNGCVNGERSLPVVCRHIKPDGTFDSFEDSFHICKAMYN